VSEGSITFDGHDIRDATLDSLRLNIGVVPQDTVLFNASIMYNLLYAKPNATEMDVFEACKAANIHDRILAFPDGYNTKVGERGLKLSGGERQRVSKMTIKRCSFADLDRLPSPALFSRTRGSCSSMRPPLLWIRTRSDRSKTP
jgi:ABC-type transport system involved in Fe-S cluster assembly fused permease/ATPase subunit